jgi:hypothetical protein
MEVTTLRTGLDQAKTQLAQVASSSCDSTQTATVTSCDLQAAEERDSKFWPAISATL